MRSVRTDSTTPCPTPSRPFRAAGRSNHSGKATFDDFAFEISKSGKIELTDEGEDIVEQALFLASGPEAAGLPGYLGGR